MYVQGFVYDYLYTHDHVQNTGQEFDGSDSGARPDEAVSWGKIRAGAESVKVGNWPPGPYAHINLSLGVCRRDTCVPVACRGNVCSGYETGSGIVGPGFTFMVCVYVKLENWRMQS